MPHPVTTLSFVTGIHPDGRAPGYLVVEVDGARFASLPAEVVQSIGVGAGVRLEGEIRTALDDAAATEAAYQVGLRALRARSRSRFELTRRLAERGFRGSPARAAIGRLEHQGFLDDEAYARTYAEVRAGRGHGATRIVSDLSRRGVDRTLAERVVREALGAMDFDESAAIRRAIEKRLPGMRGLSSDTKKRRLLGYLQRRGYTGPAVWTAVDHCLAEETTA